MTMFSTKYPNTSRTVSGLTAVFNTDSILEVDTSTVGATINLGIIAQGFWNTTWKLYVFDKSNNAAVNNITINAGAGQTINGQSSLVINTNGGGVLIRIISNTKFLGSLTIVSSTGITLTTTGSSGAATLVGSTLNIPIYSGGGGSSLEIKNQGTTLTTAATSINFAGAGVSSTNVGGAVTVNIAGGGATTIIPLTNGALLALINSNTVVPSQLYQVTDAILNTGDLGVILTGTSTRSVSSNGTGLFYNADYQGGGDYSSVTSPTFSGTVRGIWYSSYAGTVAIGDVVIWNNQNWINTSGLWGGSPSSDPTNWSVLSRSATTGYILEADFVSYNVLANEIIFRLDKRGNQVTNSTKIGLFDTIKDFQWGRNKNSQNIICGLSNVKPMINSGATFKYNFFESSEIVDITPDNVGAGNYYSNHLTSSQINITANKGNVEGNTMNNGAITISTVMDSGSVISKNTINSSGTIVIEILTGSITNNTIINDSTINILNCNGTVEDCYLKNLGSLTILTVNVGVIISKCEISDSNTVSLITVASNIINYAVRRGYSNWEITLSAVDVLTSTTINLLSTYSYVGVFIISNIAGSTISSITNLPSNHPCIFKPNSTSTFRIVPVAIGSAVTDNVIETASTNVGGQTYTGRTNGCDEAVLSKYGTLVGLTIKNIWI